MADSAFIALVRRAFLDARIRTAAFAYVFGAYAWAQAAGFKTTYPTLADRLGFARSFAGNDAIRLFYGYPYNVMTVGGYSAWRVGGTLVLASAVYGVLASVRALRAEEDAGRAELMLASGVSRMSAFTSAMAAMFSGAVILWIAESVGFIVAGLPAGSSLFLGLATTSVLPVFIGIGALASQFAPTRRGALGLASVAVGVFWLIRVVSDTVASSAWLRWLTPLGWEEELRPFTGSRPAVLLLPIAAAVPLLVAAARLESRRDIGTGLLPGRDSASPNRRLLSSPAAQTVRSERGTLAVWAVCSCALASILGMISNSISGAGVSANVQRQVAKLGTGSVVTPSGYLALVFIVFVFAVCVFACSQVGAARVEEAEGRVETLLALPVGRVQWLAGRLMVTVVAAVGLSLIAGLVSWSGASSQGVQLSFWRTLEAGANCLPASMLFLGIAALAYALVPRVSSALSYALVTLAFLWFMVGSIAGLPRWIVDLTPFRHIGLVPVQAFQTLAAIIMAAVGVLMTGLALAVFRHRDLSSD